MVVSLKKDLNIESPEVFLHIDLIGSNMIYDEKSDAFRFIDFEYSTFGNRGFDFANHFCEWTGFEFDYSKFPTEKQQKEFLASYYKSYYNKDPTEDEVHQMYREANKYTLVSHSFWGVWGLIEAVHSDVDFDYLDYSKSRFNLFKKYRDEKLKM